MSDVGVRLVATALALLPLIGVALALGRIFSEWLASIARNPSASERMQPVGLLAFALTEAIALLALVVAFLILFVG